MRLKLFEEFQPGMTNEIRFFMYVPEGDVWTFEAVADSEEEMMDIDNKMHTQHPERVWYQFDLTKSHPGGGTLINKRIVKGAPNAEKYINDPEFEHDTPMSVPMASNIPTEVEKVPDLDMRSGDKEEMWLDPKQVGELR